MWLQVVDPSLLLLLLYCFQIRLRSVNQHLKNLDYSVVAGGRVVVVGDMNAVVVLKVCAARPPMVAPWGEYLLPQATVRWKVIVELFEQG